jgi:hypothetical protein
VLLLSPPRSSFHPSPSQLPTLYAHSELRLRVLPFSGQDFNRSGHGFVHPSCIYRPHTAAADGLVKLHVCCWPFRSRRRCSHRPPNSNSAYRQELWHSIDYNGFLRTRRPSLRLPTIRPGLPTGTCFSSPKAKSRLDEKCRLRYRPRCLPTSINGSGTVYTAAQFDQLYSLRRGFNQYKRQSDRSIVRVTSRKTAVSR